MEQIADLAASVLANPGVCQEIRDPYGNAIFYVVSPAVYNRHVRKHVTRSERKPRPPRPAGKQSYRQRHQRNRTT